MDAKQKMQTCKIPFMVYWHLHKFILRNIYMLRYFLDLFLHYCARLFANFLWFQVSRIKVHSAKHWKEERISCSRRFIKFLCMFYNYQIILSFYIIYRLLTFLMLSSSKTCSLEILVMHKPPRLKRSWERMKAALQLAVDNNFAFISPFGPLSAD